MAFSTGLDARADFRISVLIVSGWLSLTLMVFWNSWPPDLSALYFAGHFFAIGNMDGVYAAPEGFFGPDFPQLWKDFAAGLGQDDPSIYPYVYPPIWAVLAAPVTQWVGPFTFFNVILAAQLFMTAAAIFLVRRMCDADVPRVIWVAVSCAALWFSLISTSAFVHNQLQITVTFFILLAFERHAAGRSVQAGLALAVAATIKITPALLVLIFLLDRDWRAIMAFTVLGAVITGLSFALAGIALHMVFLERLGEISRVVALMKVNYNLEAFLVQGWSLVSGVRIDAAEMIRDQPYPEPLWVTIVVWLAVVAGFALVIARSRHLEARLRRVVRLFGLLLVATLCAPLAWTHHYLPVLLLLPSLYLLYPPLRASAVIFAVVALTNMQVFMVLTRLSDVVHWQIMVGTGTMMALLGVILAAPVLSRRISVVPA